ncbi:MAG: DUF4296 domain-containing protein [Clostridium sp.]|nr:DUF4296 domain-containing protein [Clostridium sp.]
MIKFGTFTRAFCGLILASSIAVCGCSRVPKGIIPPEEMSELLADVHTAEAVATVSPRDHNNDSSKLALKIAVFERHGVTSEQFDSSLVWYAHNIGKYIEVYDDAIEILQERSQNVGTMLVQASVSMAGDSVDVWPASKHLVLSSRLPSNRVGFDLPYDENWERGDMYSFRAKVVGGEGVALDWVFVADYDDKSVEMLETTGTSNVNGWNEMTFVTDSTKQLQRLRGYFAPKTEEKAAYWVDSISLLRKRLDPARYQMRYQLRVHHGLD